jgi:ribosomal silencing factor RsfS
MRSYNTLIIGTGCAGFNAADKLYDLGVRDIAIVTEGRFMGTSRNTGSDKQTYYKLSLCGITPNHTEGKGNGGWVLIDYGCVLVHVFSRDAREFYNLEKLYEGTSEQDISGLLTED